MVAGDKSVEVPAGAAGQGSFFLPERDQGYSGARQASAPGVCCALEKELECLLGPAEEEREQAAHLPRKGILHECSAQKRLGAGPRISYVDD